MRKSKNKVFIPQRVYKYVTAQRIDILKNGEIRFTQPELLNDLFDIKPKIQQMYTESDRSKQYQHYMNNATKGRVAKEVAREQILSEAASKRLHLNRSELRRREVKMKKILLSTREFHYKFQKVTPKISIYSTNADTSFAQKFPDLINKSNGVLSLAHSYENILMWSHYTDSHRGFVIGFESKKMFVKPGLQGIEPLQAVEYEDFSPLQYVFKNGKISPEAMRRIFYVKGKEWKYEQEWRMISRFSKAKRKIIGLDSKPIYLYQFAANSVTDIIFGSRISQDDKTAILEVLNENRYKHVRVSQSVAKEGKIYIEPYK